jgi:hypothetical protein
MTVNVLLSGRLRLDGYGVGKPENNDGTHRLALPEESTVRQVIRQMGVPLEKVVMTMINGRRRELEARVKPGDRVILIPSDVAALWRGFGRLNMGMETVFDF